MLWQSNEAMYAVDSDDNVFGFLNRFNITRQDGYLRLGACMGKLP